MDKSTWVSGGLGCLLLVTLALPARAAAPATPETNTAPPVTVEWDARWRYEHVNDDAFAPVAYANTLRLRLGLKGNFGHGWSGLAEGAGVARADNHYNSGSNGRTQYPTIADPSGALLNQAWLAWSGNGFGAILGRQRLQFDNQRWVGNSGWRQFEQTFDALALKWQVAPSLRLRYAWLDRVHRVPGPSALNKLARARNLNTHLINAAWTHGAQEWVGYAYLHKDRDVASASTATFGARWTGHLRPDGQGLGWALEAAHQTDYANNPLHFGHAYWLVEPSWTQRGITAKVGWEYLGSNGHHALQTPLASLHPFNGWDDKFGVIPNGGLRDGHASATGHFGHAGTAGKLAWTVAWHDYHAVHGDRYGSEWDGSLAFPIVHGLSALVELADYRADTLGRDDTKFWLQLVWKGAQSL